LPACTVQLVQRALLGVFVGRVGKCICGRFWKMHLDILGGRGGNVNAFPYLRRDLDAV